MMARGAGNAISLVNACAATLGGDDADLPPEERARRERAREITKDLLQVAEKHGDDKMIGLAKSFYAIGYLYDDDPDRYVTEHRAALRAAGIHHQNPPMSGRR